MSELGKPDASANHPVGAEGSTKGGASLRKALNLLTIVGARARGMEVRTLIAMSGLTRPTAYRMMAVLTEEGFLGQDDRTKTVTLGPQFLRLAQQVWSDGDLRRTAGTELERLSEATGGTAMLLVRSTNMMTCVETSGSGSGIGSAEPVLGSVGGRALLAFGDWEAIDDAIDDLEALGNPSGRTGRELKSDLAVVRSRFYAVDDDPARAVLSVAAPVFDFSSQPIAAVALHTERTPERAGTIHDLGAAVVQAARRISSMRGGYPFGIDVPQALAEPEDLKAKLLVDARCLIGDSPSVDDRTGDLTWIDILAPAIHRFDRGSGTHDVLAGQEVIGAAIPTGDGGFVIAEQTRLRFLDSELAETGRRAVTELPPGFRFNDGARDREGRLWLGVMDMAASRGTGFLLRYADHDARAVTLPGFSLPNGIAFSPSGERMYVIDSMERQLSTFCYDPATGEAELANRAALLRGEDGRPSGLTIDRDGTILTCHWDGSAVIAISEDGEILARHPLPVPRPSGLAFDLDHSELFVTSARVRMSERDLVRFPRSGSVYRLCWGPSTTSG